MKVRIGFLVTAIFILSLACQLVPPPAREGVVISDCTDIVRAVNEVQPTDIPQSLRETGVKQGTEFDANDYFKILTHLSMQSGYSLDYVFPTDFFGAYPMLYARASDQPPYASFAEVPEGTKLGNYFDRLEIEDVEQGYFQTVVMNIMAGQFYLFWHANYNDTQIVCDRAAADAIVDEINAGDFGYKMDLKQQAQVRALTNIEPMVRLTEDSAIVEVTVFSKWGGFFRQTYTISRSFPHTLEMKDENLVPYDCGIVF